MEIKVDTCYGDVTLQYCYDCEDPRADFYTAYDENGDCLGELWNVPMYDEDDDESLDCIRVAVETAIECCDIATPMTLHKDVEICVATVLETINGFSIAYSNVFSNMDKCREYKIACLEAFCERLGEQGILRDIVDADLVCEVKTANTSLNYMCITMKRCTVQ